ncbi:MAG: hypothetical protein WC758_03345 [Candidatus Woesearchaeota archaeon]|jgi:hypothetical protein
MDDNEVENSINTDLELKWCKQELDAILHNEELASAVMKDDENTVRSIFSNQEHLGGYRKSSEVKINDEKSNEVYSSKNNLWKLLLAATMGAGIALSGNYLLNKPKSFEQLKEPTSRGSSFSPSYSFSAELFNKQFYARYTDDNSVGMKGYALVKNKITELKGNSEDLDDKTFLLPKDLVKENSQFEIFAIDRDGNKSEMKILYTFEGYVSDKKINR